MFSKEDMKTEICVRTLRDSDLAEADRIVRLAFGTFLGLPDPLTFMGDAAYVRPRFLADPAAAYAAEIGGELAGSSFATNWGSFGYFGPLTIRPDLWDRGIAKRLMEAMVDCFTRWGTRNAGLFTFAHSQKHVGLYQKFGFWPRFLTAIMSKSVERKRGASPWSGFSEVPQKDHGTVLKACRDLTDSIYEGLDVGREIRAVSDQRLGDTVLLWNGSTLTGMAVCHYGPGTEAGSGKCYVKFAAAPTERALESVLDACEEMAAAEGLSHLVAGVNMARHEAYLLMMARGFRVDYQGVAMQRPNEPGYNRPGVYVIDDWR
jgi:GNAT superfamily N-acetyltransferase